MNGDRAGPDALRRTLPGGARHARVAATPSVPALRARLTGMAERTRAMLAWHFTHDPASAFVEAGPDERADAVIVDADHPEAIPALDAIATRAAREGAVAPPVVMLAFARPATALAARATHVAAKPVSAEALVHAAAVLRARAPAQVAALRGASARAHGHAPDRRVPETEAARPPGPSAERADEARVRLREQTLCGTCEAIDAALAAPPGGGRDPRAPDASDDAARALFFDPSRHLGALLARELDRTASAPDRVARALTVEMAHLELFVLPDVDRVYASASLASVETARRTFGELDPGEAAVVHHAGAAVGALLGRVRTGARGGYTLDAFTWLAALMSSRGRLPLGTDRDRPLRLARWPNLTRLEPVPHAIELASRWSEARLSIAALVRDARVEPRFVHAFHNAALSLDLFEPDPGGQHG